MVPGDHILYCGTHEHHAIYCGDIPYRNRIYQNVVIHFEGKFKRGEIRGLSFDKFAQGRDIYVARYQKGSCFSADVVIKRAISKLGEPDYNLLGNNCEHLAHWCKAGTKRCGQVHNFMEETGGILGGAIAGGVAGASLPLAVPGVAVYGVCLAAGYAGRELGKIGVNLFSDRPEYDIGGIPF
ncbi:lecithin retinol acyltransferase family protein [Nodularia sphaerocarpa]|uniref:lecithin retinol acyltransferase family protein n=1 Tax=Nodularia sphaerocarpa TaxID=137816 RepID=UPI0023313F7E|nr:lecithin retinol acyltransferase family protein [Nodularia sphaerocarpa]MDB9372163.1 lecithin retinol acyltransferase family protein [Nodularia sphaerocarpa CS-585]MDB9379180.1 lecithin retinol acyltransferase family protein [Nodularia sphaerocarpa CS-585A2]